MICTPVWHPTPPGLVWWVSLKKKTEYLISPWRREMRSRKRLRFKSRIVWCVIENVPKNFYLLPYLMIRRIPFSMNEIALCMVTKCTGSSFHTLTGLLPWRCDLTNILDSAIVSLLSWPSVWESNSCWKATWNKTRQAVCNHKDLHQVPLVPPFI